MTELEKLFLTIAADKENTRIMEEFIKQFKEIEENIKNPKHSINQEPVLKNYVIKKYSDIKLSTREQECLSYLLCGKTSKETAKALGLSYRTIERYNDNIKIKFNCRSKAELISVAIQTGYLNCLG